MLRCDSIAWWQHAYLEFFSQSNKPNGIDSKRGTKRSGKIDENERFIGENSLPIEDLSKDIVIETQSNSV